MPGRPPPSSPCPTPTMPCACGAGPTLPGGPTTRRRTAPPSRVTAGVACADDARRTPAMTLTPGITLIILFAALLHASWNALIKSGRDVLMDTALVAAGATVVAAPKLLILPPPAPTSRPHPLRSKFRLH